jgi:hypothetical protein
MRRETLPDCLCASRCSLVHIPNHVLPIFAETVNHAAVDNSRNFWVRLLDQGTRKSSESAIELRTALGHSSLRVVIMKPFVIALSVLVVAVPSFAFAASDADGYPPGLFEHSPLIDPSHPAKQVSASVAAHRFERGGAKSRRR